MRAASLGQLRALSGPWALSCLEPAEILAPRYRAGEHVAEGTRGLALRLGSGEAESDKTAKPARSTRLARSSQAWFIAAAEVLEGSCRREGSCDSSGLAWLFGGGVKPLSPGAVCRRVAVPTSLWC